MRHPQLRLWVALTARPTLTPPLELPMSRAPFWAVLAAVTTAAVVGTTGLTATESVALPAAPRCAQAMVFNPGAQLDASCVVDMRPAPQVKRKPKPPHTAKPLRLPRMRVARVGAHVRAHVTATV